MTDSIIYVRRSYVKDGSADISDEVQETAVRSVFPDDASVRVIRDSYDPDDPGSKRKHSGGNENRDGYQELITLIRSGSVKRVGVYDLSRLMRETRLMLNLKHEMDNQGIHLVVATMPGSNFNDAAGRFQFGIMCGAAQYQRDVDVEGAKRRTRRIFLDGRHNGLDPFGYRGEIIDKKRTLVIVDHEAEIVRRVWRDLAHKDQRQIARDLNNEGVKRRTNAPWTKDAVKDIWRRGRFYLGFVQWRRPGHIDHEEQVGRHEAIIDEQTYRDAVMASIQRGPGAGRRPLPYRTYVVKGLIECECGKRMRGQALGSRGREWRYYRCPECSKVSINADEAEQVVIDAMRTMMLPARAIGKARDELARRLRVPTTGLSDRKRQRLTRRLNTAKEMRLEGELSPEEYRAEKTKIEQELTVIPDSAKLIQFDSHLRVVLSLADSIDKASPKRLAELVKLLVERVPVENGTIDPEQIVWSPPARPFFGQALLEAPPEGFAGLPGQ